MLTNHHNADTYGNLMQGKFPFDDNSSTPRLVWNQIKVLILSNKDGNDCENNGEIHLGSLLILEFDIERDLLVTETLPKLQQYFLTQGVYIYFVDPHLNWPFDWTTNPYHVQRVLKELQDAHRSSAGLFLLVSSEASVNIQ